MTDMRNWMIWPDNAVLSVLILVLIAMIGLYAARAPMHGIIRAASFALAGALRLASRWLFAAAAQMKERNKAVLLAQGRREVGQRIEREFERVGVLVTRDLQGYPVLQRKLLEAITRIRGLKSVRVEPVGRGLVRIVDDRIPRNWLLENPCPVCYGGERGAELRRRFPGSFSRPEDWAPAPTPANP